MSDEPLDLAPIEARDANYTAGAQLLRDRRALLAEVKRLRAQGRWLSSRCYQNRHDTCPLVCTGCGEPCHCPCHTTQPEETP